MFTSNSGRCHQSGDYFCSRVLGDDYSEDTVEFVVVDEDKKWVVIH